MRNARSHVYIYVFVKLTGYRDYYFTVQDVDLPKYSLTLSHYVLLTLSHYFLHTFILLGWSIIRIINKNSGLTAEACLTLVFSVYETLNKKKILYIFASRCIPHSRVERGNLVLIHYAILYTPFPFLPDVIFKETG